MRGGSSNISAVGGELVASVMVMFSLMTLAMLVAEPATDAALKVSARTAESIRERFNEPEGACWVGDKANDMK